jgi:hypothetical protein
VVFLFAFARSRKWRDFFPKSSLQKHAKERERDRERNMTTASSPLEPSSSDVPKNAEATPSVRVLFCGEEFIGGFESTKPERDEHGGDGRFFDARGAEESKRVSNVGGKWGFGITDGRVFVRGERFVRRMGTGREGAGANV